MGSESSTDSKTKALENLKKAESEFELNLLASTLAHEIRNPLQSIRLQLDLASRGKGVPEALKNISDDIKRLESVVSKVQQLGQKHVVNPEIVNLRKIVETSLASLGFWLSASGILVRTHSNWEGEPLVEGDAELLQQVLLNLFMNAIQAMPSGGTLSVYIHEEMESAVVEVTDSGQGFEPETMKMLGTPFYTTKANGHGLGLAFCRSIAALHGGSVEFENLATGGARVMVRIAKTLAHKEGADHVQ